MPEEKTHTDHEWRLEVRNWLHHLSGHDLTDIRGMILGLGTLIHLMATKIPPGPRWPCGTEAAIGPRFL